MNGFQYDTGVVLDVPEPVCSEVMGIRARYDKKRTVLPIEITIIGSSGIGTLAEDQDPKYVFEVLDKLAQNSPPIQSSFVRLTHFPNTPIFYLEPKDPKPFVLLQNKIVDTQLRFNEIQHPFTPHCTIAILKGISDKKSRELESSAYPRQDFTLDCMSVYSLDGWDCHLLYRTKLRGSS